MPDQQARTGEALPPQTFVDAIDAAREGSSWLRDQAKLLGLRFPSMTWASTKDGAPGSGGGVGSLWDQGYLVATAVFVRDDLNRSVLVRTILPRSASADPA